MSNVFNVFVIAAGDSDVFADAIDDLIEQLQSGVAAVTPQPATSAKADDYAGIKTLLANAAHNGDTVNVAYRDAFNTYSEREFEVDTVNTFNGLVGGTDLANGGYRNLRIDRIESVELA